MSETGNVSDDQDEIINDPDEIMDDQNDEQITENNEDVMEEYTGTIIFDEPLQKKQKVRRQLPQWLANPSIISANIATDKIPLESLNPPIDKQILQLLEENGIKELFPVQGMIIPELLKSASCSGMLGYLFSRGGCRPRDICCSAPTGSGKTLSFVIPIVQILRHRPVRAVRCLVVVPVGDLAAQVHRVFQQYCKHTDLKVGLVNGLKTFAAEQASIVKKGPNGYQSLVDIIVGTPGRLVDHISRTPGFDLTVLRFLVIDEADRVMEEVKQDWLSHVEKAVFKADSYDMVDDSIHDRPDPFKCNRSSSGLLTVEQCDRPQIPLQKLLFSATLSHNPEKLDQLKLFHPKLFTSVVKHAPEKKPTVSNGSCPSESVKAVVAPTRKEDQDNGEFLGKYVTPFGLSEKFIECTKAEKPMVLLHLLRHYKYTQALCFTNSVESTHRLCHLMKLVGVAAKEFSSNLHVVKRSRILKQFATGKITLLISSDAMARGMDVDNVQCVISYELPPFLKTYIHRVGRTARAGKTGTGITLLEKKEVFHFKKMLTQSGKTEVKEIKIKQSELKPYMKSMTKALATLPNVLKTDKKQKSKRS